MKFEVKMDSPSKIAQWKGLGKCGAIQKFIDSEVIRLSAPYTPFSQGALIESATNGTEIGSGEVVYNAPYARYLYYGYVMAGRAPKQLTNRPITYQGAPKRGAYWFERMKQNHGKEILRGAERAGNLNR